MGSRFTDKDLSQIKERGSTPEKVERQLADFRSGFGWLPVERAATVGDGIIRLSPRQGDNFRAKYKAEKDALGIVKFVPASGAATRMFKDLFEYLDSGTENAATRKTLDNISKFAFYYEIKNLVFGKPDREVIRAVVDYGANLPKALIFFHKYPEGARTALEEHLVEGAMYASAAGKVRLHITISPEHREGFDREIEAHKRYYEKRFGVTYDIELSYQESSTDTIAATPDNEPFREEDGSLLFRPAGHGALIENLDRIDADIIFIKTVDNVAPDHLKNDTVASKEILGGVLLDLRGKIFALLDAPEGAEKLPETERFVTDELMVRLPERYAEWNDGEKVDFLRRLLDRPLRVCGMVRNEGEPGGGPFWVRGADGSSSLQIVEPAQIVPEKRSMIAEGTHFNPVDLACSVKDRSGGKYDLRRFTDPSTGFISEKTRDGRPLKAQELPGLWNGSMARWNTVFVEVPVSTFSPVKEVTDLLRPQHQ